MVNLTIAFLGAILFILITAKCFLFLVGFFDVENIIIFGIIYFGILALILAFSLDKNIANIESILK